MKIRRLIPILGACSVALLASQAGGLQSGQNAKAAKPAAAPRDENPPWTLVFLGGVEQYEKTKKGQAKQVTATSDEGTVIVTDLWQWDDRAKTATGTGNLKMTDTQADATGDKVDVYYKKDKRLMVLTGNVTILVKPKQDKEIASPAAVTPKGPAPVVLQDGKLVAQTGPQPAIDKRDEESADSARKYPATITCDKAEYEYARSKKHGVLTGNFKVVQKLPDLTRTITAEHGEWFGNEEKIILYPPVHFEDTKGRTGDTESQVTIYTKEGEEKFIVPGKGVLVLKNIEDEDEADTKKSAPTANPPGKDKEPSKKTGP